MDVVVLVEVGRGVELHGAVEHLALVAQLIGDQVLRVVGGDEGEVPQVESARPVAGSDREVD